MLRELKMIYQHFPRRFLANTSWEISSFSELISCIKANIDISRCSTSIYNYPREEKDIIVDRIVFDLDGVNSQEQTRKLHEYLMDKNIKHFIVFSGANFHVYAKLCGTPVFKKDCLKNISDEVEKKLGIENDASIRGNLRHHLAIPYTFNFKRMRYVRPITEKELYMDIGEISNIAKKQGGSLVFYGTDAFIAEQYDRKRTDTSIEEFQGKVPNTIHPNLLRDLPYSCKEYMKNPNLGHHHRLRLITLLMEFGLSKEQTISVLKSCLSPVKFHHCVFQERQVDYVYSKRYEILEKGGNGENNR